MKQWVEDHSLSFSFALLFLTALAGQSVSGHFSYNSELSMHGLPPLGYVSYLGTGNFLDGMFTNWQAALLQLGCLIVFGEKFREKGAAHSLKPKGQPHRQQKGDGKRRPWIYRHSLSLAFVALFSLSFMAHLLFGVRDYNAKLQMIHRPPIATVEYAVSSAFWFSNTNTWEAEFAAIAIYVVLSIFLRQQGSPESKPVDSRNSDTGETND